MKKVLFFCLTLLYVGSSFGQAPNIRYWVCKRPLGQDCNSTIAPISCAFEWAPSDPCELYSYYSPGPDGTPVKLKCCSQPTGTSAGDQPYVYGGHYFIPDDSSYKLLVSCNGTEDYVELYNFSSIVSSYSRPGVIFENRNDSLVLKVYETDTVSPFIKSGSLVEVLFALEDIDDLCDLGGGIPFSLFFNDVKIVKTPTMNLEILNNPITNGALTIRFYNPEVYPYIQSMDIVDVNGKILKMFPASTLKVGEKEHHLPIRTLQAGIYFLRVTSEFEQRSFKFVVTH